MAGSPSSAVDPRLPVIVGVGQYVQRPADVDDPDGIGREPLALMIDAVAAAVADAGIAALPARLGAIRTVNSLSWRYRNPSLLLAERIGIGAAEYGYGHVGGNTPQQLVNGAAAEIASGRLDVALIVGGESWRSRMRAQRAGRRLEWAKAPDDVPPTMVGDDIEMNNAVELAAGADRPTVVYPMFETALRHAVGRSPEEQQRVSSELWARFSAVAAGNPHAWIQRAWTADEIAAPTPENRLVSLPYTKVMNSNNDVDMAAALIVCSVAEAERRGVPRDRWVFVHAGVDCHEHPFVSERWELAVTPAIELGGRRVLELAGIGIDEVAVIDLYSCFPSAVQIGARSLGLDATDAGGRALTRTGGLSFAGGPWNNYVGHSIAAVVDGVRAQPGEHGLVWANGGYLTKHSFGVYATTPPAGGFRRDSPQVAIDALPRRQLAEGDEAVGPATVESYTVNHGRDGDAERAVVTVLLPDGRRAWGASSRPDVLAAMLDGERVGTAVELVATEPLAEGRCAGALVDNLRL